MTEASDSKLNKENCEPADSIGEEIFENNDNENPITASSSDNQDFLIEDQS